MKKLHFILLLKFVVLQSQLIAQQTHSTIPASPTVASLEKYGVIPVRQHSGVADIQVPLHTMSAKSITLPIALQYHSSGIQTSDYGGWVGLGWSLHAGGVISRSPAGLPDEHPKGYWMTGPIPLNPDNNYHSSVAKGQIDTRPDRFTAIFPEGSVTFSIDKQGNILQFPHKGFTIIRNGGSHEINSFEIVGKSGIRYEFAAREKTRTEGTPNGSQGSTADISEYTSAWYLTKIAGISPEEEIVLEYVQESYPAFSMSISQKDYISNPLSGLGHPSLWSQTCSTPDLSSYYTAVMVPEAKRLYKITNTITGEEVRFVAASQERPDFPGMYRLERVEVRDKGDTLYKSWNLDYGSFPALGTSLERLRLESVQEKGKNQVSKPAYTFEYNEGKLPDPSTLDYDHWGYYNGPKNNTQILPEVTVDIYGQSSIITKPGADRSVDSTPTGEYLQRGMLTKMHYPTGGSSSFTYEPNDYGYDETGREVMDILVPQTLEVTAGINQFQQEVFTPNHTGWAIVSYDFDCSRCSFGELPLDGDSNLQITDPTGQVFAKLGYSALRSHINGQGENFVWLEANQNYTLSIQGDYSINGTATLYWNNAMPEELAGADEKKRRAGGLRIKSIEHYDGIDSGNNTVYNYRYQMEDDTDRSSGLLLNLPKAYTKVKIPTLITDPQASEGGQLLRSYLDCIFFMRSASNTLRQTGSNSGHIAYKEVVEEINNGENGYVKSFYTHTVSNPTHNNSPYPQSKPDGYLRGNLRQEKIYNASGVLLQNTNYHYSVGDALGSMISFATHRIERNGDPSLDVYYNVHTRFESRPYNQTRQTIVKYDENGLNPMTLVTETSYHNEYVAPVEIRTTNSDGIEHIERVKYAGSYLVEGLSSTDPMVLALQQLQEQYRYATPVEEYLFIQKSGSEYLTGSTLRTYSIVNGQPALQNTYKGVLTTPVATYETSSIQNNTFAWDTSVYKVSDKILSYDAYYNITHRKPTNSAANAYIWGYENKLPTTKVLNASPADIGYTGFNTQDETDWILDTAAIRIAGKTGPALQSTSAIPLKRMFAVNQQDESFTFSAWIKTNRNAPKYLVLQTHLENDLTANVAPGTSSESNKQMIVENTNGNWKLIKITIDLSTIRMQSGLASGTPLYIQAKIENPSRENITIDEVRFHPTEALMQTFQYHTDNLQLEAMSDENNLSKQFVYDDFGRLSYVLNHNGHLINAYEYYYKDQSSVPNYVRSKKLRKSGYTSPDQLVGLPSSVVQESIQYTDGLGRPLQTVQKGNSPSGKDKVQIHRYDTFGRDAISYLPFERGTTSGEYIRVDLTQSLNALNYFYGSVVPLETKTTKPWAETAFDASPFNRPIELGTPGEVGSIGGEATLTKNYRHNNRDEVLKLVAGGSAVVYYDENELSVEQTTDEEGFATLVYTDKKNRTILTKKQLSANNWAATYHVYNDLGHLVAIIPPLAVEKMANGNYDYTHADYEDLIFTYAYDELGRMIRKKVPDAKFITYVYNQQDKVVFSQDGNQRLAKQWNFVKYDALGRELIKGLHSYDYDRATLQATVDAQTVHYEQRSTDVWGYTNHTLPILNTTDEVLSVTYYDDYDRDRNGEPDTTYPYITESGFDTAPFYGVHGAVTGTLVKILDGGNTYLETVVYYNDVGEHIQEHSTNHLDGTDITFSQYDFVGNLTISQRNHTAYPSGSLTKIVTRQRMKYDHADRLLQVYYKIDQEDEIILSAMEYNALGQLSEKNLHTVLGKDSSLQSIDYGYNIRGWLQFINDIRNLYSADNGSNGNQEEQVNLSGKKSYTIKSKTITKDLRDPNKDQWLPLNVRPNYDTNHDLFGMYFHYDHRGNIKNLQWRTLGDNYRTTYNFAHDGMRRLTQADYWEFLENGSNNWTYQNEGLYDVSEIRYDKNGNILQLQRQGMTELDTQNNPIQKIIDQLTYVYEGNQLFRVDDASFLQEGFIERSVTRPKTREYSYDANGNMIEDSNKGISVTYNHLNLPEQIIWNSGETLQWIYDANGNKLQKITTNNQQQQASKDYVSGIEYANSKLEAVYHAEGRVVRTGTGGAFDYQYDYTVKDHLGNSRVTFADLNNDGKIETTEILQQNHYYPFGMDMKGTWDFTQGIQGVENPYQYNGVENVSDFGLEWNHTFYRTYEAALGRWHQVDPKAELLTDLTPYAFANNMPIIGNDPKGDFCVPCLIIPLVILTTAPTPVHNHGAPENWKEENQAIEDAQNMQYSWLATAAASGLAYKGASVTVKHFSKKILGTEIKMGYNTLPEATVSAQLIKGIKLCFTGDTEILTDNGLELIKNIEVGDLVWAYDDILEEKALKSVSAVSRKISDHLRVIITENDTIRTTNEHPFYVRGNWIKASNLKKGDILKTFKDTQVVKNCFTINTTVEVFNFTVKDYHSYFVSEDQLLVHNNCGKFLRSIVKKDKRILKYARQTFKGNKKLRSEANGLIDQMMKRNLSPGSGSKPIGKGIFEARSTGGARVYFRNKNGNVEILGYSNKANQQQVINLLKEIY